jgi:hypothetical protein
VTKIRVIYKEKMMAKIFIISFLILSFPLKNKCQEKFEISTADGFMLPFFKETFNRQEKIPFKEIIIRDFRFDSTKLGYIRNYGINKVVVPGSISEYLTTRINYYFRNNLTPASEKKLIIILKTFWLQENALRLTNISAINNKIKKESGAGKNTGACIAGLEVFSNNGDLYKPLLKINDNFYYGPYTKSHLWEFLTMPFDSLFDLLLKTNIETTLRNRKSYNKNEIDSAYFDRFHLPVLLNPLLKKGVFVTFDAFKANEITYPEFVVKPSKLTDELYVVTEKGEELLTNYWGYCDGKDYFIYAGLNLFKMVRQNNTWDIFGNTFISDKSNTSKVYTRYGDLLISSYYKEVELRALQLNMETGKVY